MASFTDALSRTWELEMTIGSVSRVQREVGVSILTLFEDNGKSFSALLNDPPLFANVIFLLCKRQADTLGVDVDGFLMV